MNANARLFAPHATCAALLLAIVPLGAWILTASPTEDGAEVARAPDPPASTALATPGFADRTSRESIRAEGRDGFYRAPVGTEMVLAIETTSSARLRVEMMEQGIDQAFTSRLDGMGRVRVVAREKDELIAELVFTAARAHDAAQGEAEVRNRPLEADLAKPVLVRMRDDGEILGVRFAADSHAAARGFVRSLLAGLRFVVDEDAGTSWQRDETETTGVATVRYDKERDAGHEPALKLRKTKIAYLGPPPGADPEQSAARVDLESRGSATLDRDLGWLREAEQQEKIVAETDRIPSTTTVRTTVKAKLVSCRRVAAAELADARFDGAWGSVSGHEDLAGMAEASKQASMAALLEGVTIEDLLASAQALALADPVDNAALVEAFRNLSWFLELHPEALVEAGSFIAEAPNDAARVVLNAVGAAGTEAAQTFLAAYVVGPSASPELRRMSLESSLQLAGPGATLLGAVLDAATGPAQEIRGTALLVLGALASKDTEQQGALVDALLSQEKIASSEGRLSTWLAALGNTGDARVFDPASAYLDHGDPGVRASAVAAIARVTTPPATAALVERAHHDADRGVRLAALEALARRADTASMDAVRHAMNKEDGEVRLAVIQGLGRQIPKNGEALAILHGVAAQDPSAKIRSIAQKIVDQSL